MKNGRNEAAKDKLTKISENWFLREPLLFSVFCTHRLAENGKISIPFRCGKMRIEYNAKLVDEMPPAEAEARLRTEVVRIILKHPYQRLPPSANRACLSLASDMTIADATEPPPPFLTTPEAMELPKNLCFEEYYAKLLENIREYAAANSDEDFDDDDSEDDEDEDEDSEDDEDEDEDSEDDEDEDLEDEEEIDEDDLDDEDDDSDDDERTGGFADMERLRQMSELWEEDEEARETVNAAIEEAQQSGGWGTVSGRLQQIIEASLVVQMDYRRMLAMFRASIISTSRRLTRMRPNRRYGFENMGSRRDFTTKLLVAVDVSGSISDDELKQFFSIVNRFFKYGIEAVYVLQFDADLTEKLVPLRKAKREVKVTGRGGTDFQPALDFYAEHDEYDGLIVFTDGCAATPKVASPRRILWVLTSRAEYDAFCSGMLPNLPGSRATYIPT